jgi:hypothetical protein
MGVESKLAELGIKLPETPRPMANYVPAVTSGNLVVVPISVVYRREAGGRLPMAVWGRAKL